MAEAKKRIDSRSKNWTCIIYPESVVKDWVEIINNTQIEWVESPWHDKDLNADGTEKKCHKHILLCFSSNKSYEQVKEFCDVIGSTVPQKCINIKGMIRYFAHVDNPEKVQYNKNDVIGHNGFDISSYFQIGRIDRYQCLKDIGNYIKDNKITDFLEFYNYCSEYRFDDWFRLICDNSCMLVKELIKSQWLRNKNGVETTTPPHRIHNPQSTLSLTEEASLVSD